MAAVKSACSATVLDLFVARTISRERSSSVKKQLWAAHKEDGLSWLDGVVVKRAAEQIHNACEVGTRSLNASTFAEGFRHP